MIHSPLVKQKITLTSLKIMQFRQFNCRIPEKVPGNESQKKAEWSGWYFYRFNLPFDKP